MTHLELTKDDLDNVIKGLEVLHRDTLEKATGWSYDLEGDFEKYEALRKIEMELACTINRVKRQRTIQETASTRTPDKPLEPWELKLLSGEIQ